jgi:hypothetical protein
MLANLPRRLDAVYLGQVDIDDDDVRLLLNRKIDSLAPLPASPQIWKLLCV